MTNLLVTLCLWKHLLAHTNFDCCVGHLEVAQIIKSRADFGITFSNYTFNLYNVKGKDLILGDFISKTATDDSNPHLITPIPP